MPGCSLRERPLPRAATDAQLGALRGGRLLAIAVERRPRDGMPRHPVAGLVVTGRNRAINRVRRERRFEDERGLLHEDQPAVTMDEIDLEHSNIGDA